MKKQLIPKDPTCPGVISHVIVVPMSEYEKYVEDSSPTPKDPSVFRWRLDDMEDCCLQTICARLGNTSEVKTRGACLKFIRALKVDREASVWPANTNLPSPPLATPPVYLKSTPKRKVAVVDPAVAQHINVDRAESLKVAATKKSAVSSKSVFSTSKKRKHGGSVPNPTDAPPTASLSHGDLDESEA
jgi:hypothetical protein